MAQPVRRDDHGRLPCLLRQVPCPSDTHPWPSPSLYFSLSLKQGFWVTQELKHHQHGLAVGIHGESAPGTDNDNRPREGDLAVGVPGSQVRTAPCYEGRLFLDQN